MKKETRKKKQGSVSKVPLELEQCLLALVNLLKFTFGVVDSLSKLSLFMQFFIVTISLAALTFKWV